MLLALIAIGGLAACGSSDSDDGTGGSESNTSTEAKSGDTSESIPTIVVRNGEPVDDVQELEYSAGDEIRFRVSSNQADEVHVHGYDVEEEIPAGGTATLSFAADIEGIFEVELHGSETQIAELRVNP